MSGAPPGYNPNESMLQGGDAPIQPVMGGGGMPPAGYQPSESMLQGGESVSIQPVMGGGADCSIYVCEKDQIVKRATQAATDEIAKASANPLVETQAIAAASAAAAIAVDKGGTDVQAIEAARKAVRAIVEPCVACGTGTNGKCSCPKPTFVCDEAATEDYIPDTQRGESGEAAAWRAALVALRDTPLKEQEQAAVRIFLREVCLYAREGGEKTIERLYQEAREEIGTKDTTLSARLYDLLNDYKRRLQANLVRKADLFELLSDDTLTPTQQTALAAAQEFYELQDRISAVEDDVKAAYRKTVIGIGSDQTGLSDLVQTLTGAWNEFKDGGLRRCMVRPPKDAVPIVGEIQISEEAQDILAGVSLGDRERVAKAATAAYAMTAQAGYEKGITAIQPGVLQSGGQVAPLLAIENAPRTTPSTSTRNEVVALKLLQNAPTGTAPVETAKASEGVLIEYAAKKAAIAAAVMTAKELQDAATKRKEEELAIVPTERRPQRAAELRDMGLADLETEAAKRAEETRALEDELQQRALLEDTKEIEEELEQEDPKPVMVEYYRLDEIKPFFQNLLTQKRNLLATDATWRTQLVDAMSAYEARRLAVWKQSGFGKMAAMPVTGAFRTMKANETITAFSRLVTVLPMDTQTLVVVPPIRGDDLKYLNVLQTLESLGILQTDEGDIKVTPGVIIAFMPPFYAPPTDLTLLNPLATEQTRRQNILLLSLFLDLERSNQGLVHVLSEQTPDNFVVGELFHTRRQIPSGRPTSLVNLLEPSYLLYPYRRGKRAGILLSSSNPAEPILPGPKAAPDGMPRIPTLSASPFYGKGFSMSYKPNTLLNDSTGYFSLRSVAPGSKLQMPERFYQQSPNCQNLLGTIRLDELEESQFLTPVAVKDDAGTLRETDILIVLRLNANKATYAPLCEGSGDARIIRPVERADKFYGANPKELHLRGVDVVLAEVNARLYKLRKPAPMDETNVMADWKAEKYTEDEAAFLNDLNLRPGMLEEIYPLVSGRPWQEFVADFLKSMSISKCFQDETLLTKRECEISRKFMNEVMDYFVKHDIVATHLREEEEDAARLERARVRSQQKQANEAKQELAVRTPDSSEAAELDAGDFSKLKSDWNRLSVHFEQQDGSRVAAATSLIMVDRLTGAYKFVTVRVPKETYDADSNSLYEKINALKEKYPGYYFIY